MLTSRTEDNGGVSPRRNRERKQPTRRNRKEKGTCRTSLFAELVPSALSEKVPLLHSTSTTTSSFGGVPRPEPELVGVTVACSFEPIRSNQETVPNSKFDLHKTMDMFELDSSSFLGTTSRGRDRK